jgi:hypothetical protein
MPLKPRPGDSREWEREEKHVEHSVRRFRCAVHPTGSLRKLRSRIDHAPKEAHHYEGEHAQP